MNQYSGPRRVAAFLLLAAVPSVLPAVDTHVWEQNEQADFARGTVKNLSIRSDGRLTLAPRFKELDSTTVPYLWSVAEDSQGVLYYAGGAPTGASTKIYAVTPGEKPHVLRRNRRFRSACLSHGFARQALCRGAARRQNLPHRKRQAPSLLRCQMQIHLGHDIR